MTSPDTISQSRGITGQDGSYMAELLLQQGYEVHGLFRRNASEAGANLANLEDNVRLKVIAHYGDITDVSTLLEILSKVRPSEIYNFAAQSHVTHSFRVPEYTFQVNVTGVLNLLQAIVHCDLQHRTRVLQASSSEMFGGTNEILNETSPFEPKSPYAISKLTSYYLIQNYRQTHGMFAVNAISFNHESPRRGRRFVTMRVAYFVARYALRQHESKPLTLAGLEMMRDWGHARDYVKCMWKMLQGQTPLDVVIATGVTHSIQDLVEVAMETVGVTISWTNAGLQTVGTDDKTGEIVVQLDETLQRPAEVTRLLGDSSLAREMFGWTAETSFKSMIQEMVESQIDRLKRAALNS